MRTRILALSGLMAVFGGSCALGVSAQSGQNPPPAPGPMKHQRRERHPELWQALHALQRAKMDLQNGARDFDGHRAKAEELTEQAIQEIHAALKADKN